MQVIQSTRAPIDTSKPTDIPLAPAEMAEMKVHLRFLRENRKVLDLKVNAAEDLLLNGVREPTHRGLVQHLLAKVERRRVELAVQRLDPAAAARLLEGIIRFSPDIAYLLSYLETLKNAERTDAVAALSEALKRIDFATVSAAQMRRVLDLIVELIDERARPDLVFSLLQSSTFQAAFDKSAESLPAPLAEIMIPLRAAHAVIVRGAKNPFDPAALARGAGMLLRAHERVLRAQSPAVRQRLFEQGLALGQESPRQVLPGLRVLLDAFPRDDRAFSDAAFRLAGFCLTAGLESDARAILTQLKHDFPSFRLPARLLEALEGERLGDIGLSERLPKAEGRERFVNGILIARNVPVSVRVGGANDVERYAKSAELIRSLALPNLVPLIASGTTEAGVPYLASARVGRGANEVLRGQAKREQAIEAAHEITCILAALANAGVRLPDARYRRFAIEESGRIWLRDLVDAERAEPSTALASHALLARELCLDLLGRADRFVLPELTRTAIATAESCVAVVRALDELR